jgi:hypothetical protein
LYGGDEIQDYLYSILNPIALFQNGGHLNFWGMCKEPPDNVWTDWWIWLKFCYRGDDTEGDLDHSKMAVCLSVPH